MSDSQKLKDCITELSKARKEADDKLNKAVENVQQNRQELEAQSNRQS